MNFERLDGAINLFRRRGDADAMDEVDGHELFFNSFSNINLFSLKPSGKYCLTDK